MRIFKIDKSLKNELLNLYKVLSPYPEDKNVLKNLKKNNFKLAILSNGTPELLKELVNSNSLDSLFDDLFSIEEVKVYKPDFRVYEIPIKRYKIKANEITFLSAKLDVSGGGNYGYNFVWVNRNKSEFDILD